MALSDYTFPAVAFSGLVVAGVYYGQDFQRAYFPKTHDYVTVENAHQKALPRRAQDTTPLADFCRLHSDANKPLTGEHPRIPEDEIDICAAWLQTHWDYAPKRVVIPQHLASKFGPQATRP